MYIYSITERIFNLSMMLACRWYQINRSSNRHNWLYASNVLFLIVNSCYVHFSTLLFGNSLPDVHNIWHVMSILILSGVPDFSKPWDHFLIPKEITYWTAYDVKRVMRSICTMNIWYYTWVQILKLMTSFDDVTIQSIKFEYTQYFLVMHGFNLSHWLS